jgi:glycosyltransferase involved in cell wall biosynthesis
MDKETFKACRLCLIAPHVVQYHAPLYQELSRWKELDLTVVYLDTMGAGGFNDPELGYIKWSGLLLDGYAHKFLGNWSVNPVAGFFSRVNPALLREVMSARYDAILITGYATFSYLLALIVARLSGKKIIWRGESTLREVNSGTPFSWMKSLYIKFFLGRCDVLLYSCIGNKRFLEHHGGTLEKLYFFPCSVDNEYFQKKNAEIGPKDKVDIRRNLHLTEEDFVIVFCARIYERKRPMDLLRAVGRIENSHQAVVLFVGDGPAKFEAEKFARDQGIRTRFLGFKGQEDLPEFYAIADVLVMNSDYDPSPKVVNEVMNFSKPVIVTNVLGTAGDLVVDGENGFIVEVGDSRGLADKLECLIVDRPRGQKMGVSAFRQVSKWTFRACAESLVRAVKSTS